jgi:type I restriction enzyme, R subunit
MSRIGQIERTTQNRVVKLFQKELGYKFIGNLEEADNSNLREEDLLKYLQSSKQYSETVIQKAVSEFSKAILINPNDNLYQANKSVYSLLRYGVTVKEEMGKHKETVYLIDWKTPLNNNFSIAEEVTIKSQKHSKRPDIVIFINGIAIGVLELKRSTVSVSEGIRQSNDNQKDLFIKPFFTTIQLVLAGNDTEGLRYGAINTKEKYYLKWKEVSPEFNSHDEHLLKITETIRKASNKYENSLDKNIVEMIN